MFINDVNRKEEIRNIAVQHLRKYGVKYRPKKQRSSTQVPKYGKKLFKVPLQNLETETVTLTNGQQLIVPKRLQELCSYILSNVQTEGIFRKEGSKSRQHEIKLSLDRGCPLGLEHHVIDVAVVLKCFLRELPEPLIAPALNDLFLMCSLEKRPKTDVVECLLLACLLLPSENLNVLSYLMQFFHEVATFSLYNKMNFGNLSILVGPNIFPIDDKLAPKSSLTITRICEITRLLIENSKSIGVIPEYIIDQIGQLSDMENEKRRKIKRRSGSLTRMLNGFKKIVSSKNEEVRGYASVTPPDVLLTPSIHSSIKKKKAESGLSLKRKKEVLCKLPDCALLNTPFTPCKTPVCVNPNGKKNVEEQENLPDLGKEKKMHWYMRSRSMKSLKEDDSITSRRNSLGPKSLLERRWSAVSNAAGFRKKKRNSCAASKKDLASIVQIKHDEPDYVRVSKTEYEEFKSRVSAIERRISLELDHVQSDIDTNIDNVQTAYEKTLETASLSSSTDQLARRLSRDLKIRRSAEQKIIRSPSARKIGSIRRKSTEREKKNVQVARNQSWHYSQAPLLPRVNSRRVKKPQADLQTLATPPLVNGVQRSISFPKTSRPSPAGSSCKRGSLTDSLSNHASPLGLSRSNYSIRKTSGTSHEQWVSAEGYFGITTPQEESCGNSRASIAKLRSQNVGMVRAKARLFDNLQDVDTSASSSTSQSQPNSGKTSLKPSSGPCVDVSRMSCRIKALRAEDRRKKKGSISPRRRHAVVSQKHRLQSIGRQYARSSNNSAQDSLDLSTPRKDLNSLDTALLSPRSKVPYIKGPLALKTPKRLCRTPAVDKKTPFKVLATPF